MRTPPVGMDHFASTVLHLAADRVEVGVILHMCLAYINHKNPAFLWSCRNTPPFRRIG